MQDDSKLDATRAAERAWHDALYKIHASEQYPDSPDDFSRFFVQRHVTPFCEGGWSWWGDARAEMLNSLGDVAGLRVLDYGCGYGALGIYLGLSGAEVWGFDFSEAAIGTAKQAAASYGLRAEFQQMDAVELSYPAEFFDLVVGFGVLHHMIKYPEAGAELFRIMKPGGRAFFHETLWDNPLINFARRFTAEHADAGDAHLTERAIRDFCRPFPKVRVEKRNLFYMLKRLAPLPSQAWDAKLQPRPLWRAIKAVDDKILRLRPMRRYCGEAIVIAEK